MRVATLLAVVAVAAVARAASWRERRDADEGLAAAPDSASLDAEVFGADPGQRTDREKRLLIEQKVQIGNHVKNAVLNLIFGKINSHIDAKSALLGVFERTNAAKNLALLGPGTKRPPAGLGIKGILGGVLSSSAGSSLPALSGVSGSSSGGGSGGSGGADAGASVDFGGNTGGASSSSSSSSSSSGGPTTDNIPTFEGNRVSLEIPEQLFGSSFTLVTNISQILGDVILNTARRVQRFVESLKPKFRGLFGVQADAAAARKRATDDEIARAQGTAARAEDLENLKDLADNRADGESAAATASPRTPSRVSGRPEGFRSITGLEPFDFDFAVLDKLVKSGDTPARASLQAVTAAPSDVDVRLAAAQAGDILNGSLRRVAVRRRRLA